eukprot:940344-Pyramimonas_sp.AAC.1
MPRWRRPINMAARPRANGDDDDDDDGTATVVARAFRAFRAALHALEPRASACPCEPSSP